MIEKDVIVGIGEIGKPISQLISNFYPIIQYDIKQKLEDQNKFDKYKKYRTRFLHICIPFNKRFHTELTVLTRKYKPKGIIIHSTISPNTTHRLQSKFSIPVIYSPIRGIHKRMLYDLKRYTKFYAIEANAPLVNWASSTYSNMMKKCGIRTKKMSNPLTLELAKIICDTSYYGWLINYAQLSKMIAIKNKVSYDEMWSFADEIHKYLGNRPKMFPGFIGGHCVIPNLDLIKDDTLNLIKAINSDYAKILKKRQAQGKKY